MEKAAKTFEIIRINLKPNETKNIMKKGDVGDCLFIVARGLFCLHVFKVFNKLLINEQDK